MTSEQDLIRVIAENASTVDQNAKGFFNMKEFVKSDFTLEADFMVSSPSITLYNNKITSAILSHMPRLVLLTEGV